LQIWLRVRVALESLEAFLKSLSLSASGMALSDNEIIGAIKTGLFHIVPRNPKLNPAGIDLRADRSLVLRPGQQKLVATIERVELSENFLGILHIRSSLAREGIVASLALVDPGFRGQLTVSLHNAGDRLVSLRKGERFIQLSLLRLGMPARHSYVGKYQNSGGVVKSRRRQWSGCAKWKTLYRVRGAKARIQAMKDTSRILDLKYKLQTIELLNLAKEQYTYRELSGILHLPETVLSRYVKGHVLPTAERAEEINRTLQKYMSLEKELHERIKFDDLGYFDNTGIINDTMLLERAVQQAVGKFAGKRVNKVMTAAVDGVPLATLLAHRLGTRLIVAKQSREVGVREFIEEFYVPPKTAIMKSLYVSKDAFKKGEGVLIADDIIDSGETQRAMMKVILKARAEVIGIYALIAIGNEWKSRIESVGNVPVEIGLSLVKMVA